MQLLHTANEHTVRVADVSPAVAKPWLKLYPTDAVEFVECNLFRSEGRARAFGGKKWDIVINAACERKLSQVAEVYRVKIEEMSVACARLAVENGWMWMSVIC